MTAHGAKLVLGITFSLLWLLLALRYAIRASGWSSLARVFAAQNGPQETWAWAARCATTVPSFSIAVRVSASDDGLTLIPWPVYRLFAPAITVPWRELRRGLRVWMFGRTDLWIIRDVELGLPPRLTKRILERLASA